MNLTPIQLEILTEYVQGAVLESVPTIRDVAASVDLSPTTVVEHIEALVFKGALVETRERGLRDRYRPSPAGYAAGLSELARRGPAVVIPPMRLPVVRLSRLAAHHAQRVGGGA